jgi:hypothetical protein
MEFRRLVWSFAAAAGVWWKKALDSRDETVDSLELRISWFLQTRSSCSLRSVALGGKKLPHPFLLRRIKYINDVVSGKLFSNVTL